VCYLCRVSSLHIAIMVPSPQSLFVGVPTAKSTFERSVMNSDETHCSLAELSLPNCKGLRADNKEDGDLLLG
jgi:hypothetical protein